MIYPLQDPMIPPYDLISWFIEDSRYSITLLLGPVGPGFRLGRTDVSAPLTSAKIPTSAKTPTSSAWRRRATMSYLLLGLQSLVPVPWLGRRPISTGIGFLIDVEPVGRHWGFDTKPSRIALYPVRCVGAGFGGIFPLSGVSYSRLHVAIMDVVYEWLGFLTLEMQYKKSPFIQHLFHSNFPFTTCIKYQWPKKTKTRSSITLSSSLHWSSPLRWQWQPRFRKTSFTLV